MTINIGNISTPATDSDKRAIGDGLRRVPPDPITTGSPVQLVRDTHANQRITVRLSSAAPIHGPTLLAIGDTYEVFNDGPGALTPLAFGGAALVGDATLPATIAQYGTLLLAVIKGADGNPALRRQA